MFPILKASLAAIISKSLAAFLEVDDKDIETQLLGQDGKVSLRQVKLREQKIRLSNHGDNVVCYLVIAGTSTISELDLKWKWSSSNALTSKVANGTILEDSILALKRVNLHMSFRFEKEEPNYDPPSPSRPEEESSASNPGENSTKKSLSSSFKDEMGRLKRAAIGHLNETQLLQQLIQNVINSFTIKMDDVIAELVVPFSGGGFVKMGLKTLLFGTIDGVNSLGSVQPAHIKLELILSRLYADLHLHDPGRSRRETIIPILEPFSYRATIRRASGTRFVDLFNGFELVGREHAIVDKFALGRQAKGITFHQSDEAIDAFVQVRSAYFGQDNRETDYDSEIYNMNKEAPPMEAWPVSTKYILALFCLVGIVSSMLTLGFTLRLTGLLREQYWYYLPLGLWVIASLLFIGASVFIARMDLENSEGKILKDNEKAQQEKKVEDYPATFRLPLSFVTVVAPDDIQLSLTNISVMGRVDCSKIHMSAGGLNVKSGGRERGPKVSMSGLRATHHGNKTLANIDMIDIVFLPGFLHLEQPLINSVVTFEGGRMQMKLKSLRARLLYASEQEIIDDVIKVSEREMPDFSKVAATVHKTGKMLNAEIQKGLEKVNRANTKTKRVAITDASEIDARNRMNAEIYEGLFKLQVIGSMFEQIPLKKNRENLRLYPNSFRGTDAVAFVLENNMAGNKQEAVKLLRDLEIEFNLFESVTREYRFRNDQHCLYRFVDPSNRRCWKRDELPYDYIENFDRAPQGSPIPFPISIFANNIFLTSLDGKDGERVVFVTKCEIYMDKGKLARVVDFTLFLGELKSDNVAVTNGRVRGMVDPEVPKLIHRFQVSVDSLQVNPELTTEDWLETLGFDFAEEAESESKELSASQRYKEPSEPYALPHMIFSDFQLRLSWKGVMVNATETTKKVQPFLGTEFTTSNDLIKEFVVNVLGQTPGLLANVNFMGVNVFQSAGIATAIKVGAKVIPFGEYVAIGALAMYDGTCSALDAGKAARRDPTGPYKPGDLFRGIYHSAGETARIGAGKRGKTDDDYYDDDDKIQLDPLDFVVGASHGTANYANENKARFAGAYMAAAVAIGTTVALGPIGGLVAGIVVGAATEATVHLVERKMLKNGEEEEEQNLDSLMFDAFDSPENDGEF